MPITAAENTANAANHLMLSNNFEVDPLAKGSTSKLLDNIKWFAALAVFSAAVIGNSYFVEVAFLYRVLGKPNISKEKKQHDCKN